MRKKDERKEWETLYLCNIGKHLKRRFGLLVCYPNPDCPEHPCSWAGKCLECGEKQVKAYDECSGWMELCLNPKCPKDK